MKFSQKLDWFWHIVEALCMATVVGTVWGAITSDAYLGAMVGLAFGIGHFHGREKRDCEVKFKIPSPHLKSYWFGKWNYDQLTDFFAPAVVCTVIMLIISYV